MASITTTGKRTGSVASSIAQHWTTAGTRAS